jgi:cyanophycinase-like exopeptidase
MSARASRLLVSLLTVTFLFTSSLFAQSYKYFRLGQAEDAHTTPVPGFALMGGGKDLDAAFKWLCDRASGGDFLVIRHHGDDDYDPYINGLCKANSISTLILPDKAAAQDPRVTAIMQQAEAIFIAGGDQAMYLNHWAETPVQKELNAAIARGVPIGGTSAGLAVLGEFVYSAQGDAPDDEDLSSKVALANPFHPRVTVRRNFVEIPILKNTLTDTHFRKRDRMGRTLVFLSRIVQDGWSAKPREIAVEERAAVLLEPTGAATVVGSGPAYFLQVTQAPEICRPNEPLTFRGIEVDRVEPGGHFDVAKWNSAGGSHYTLSVEQGVVHSTAPNGTIY